MVSPVSWPAPAKLNLFLHINKQRSDGYHELQTVFQLLDYADELQFAVTADPTINLSISWNSDTTVLAANALALTAEPIASNLVVRAAQLLQQVTGCTLGCNIHLHKRIPIGGGLGGGSSNAATTLLALNSLWQLNLSVKELSRLGLQLGADVPVFVQGKTAWGSGVGEQLVPLNLPERWFIIVTPPQLVATKEIFSAIELTRNTPTITIQQFLAATVTLRNDCEPVACKRYPLVAQALTWLQQFGPAHLTGTGSSVFLACADKNQAQEVLAQVPIQFFSFIAKGVNGSATWLQLGSSIDN